ncbi:MAG: MurR/RpiR family transcriptional regulator, partial [Oscillospiraceae bacterium]
MEKDLMSLINDKKRKFSKGQKKIAEFINEKYDKAAFMTALKLGQTVGVSESTVVRFATELGFDGYPKLQQSMQDMIRNKLTAVQRIGVAEDQIGYDDVLNKVLNSDIEKIKKTLEDINFDEFNTIVDCVINAKSIYILGVRSSAALARYLNFYFNLIFKEVKFINTTSTSEMFEQLLHLDEKDIFIGISFPRYSTRTIKAAMFAKSRGAKVVAITDSSTSPLTKQSDYNLLARSDMASFVDS